jgi:uncharacterized protein YggU (UPF0235/DUF167 family)
LAKWIGMPKSDIEIVSGATSRLKTVLLRRDPDTLAATLDRLRAAFA